MLGIVHHSPVIISVLIDRSMFKNQIVNEEEATSGSWKQKVVDFKKSSANNRERVLFVEKVECLQAMLRGGFDPSPFKVVLYDDSKILGQIEGVDIVDAKFHGDTWQLYKLMPEKFNKALQYTDAGISDAVRDVDVKELEPDVPAPPKKTRARPVIDSAADEEKPEEPPEEKKEEAPMADADAVMESILNGAKEDGDIPDNVNVTAEDVTESSIDVVREADADATEAVGDQAAEEFAEAAHDAEEEPEAAPEPEPAPKPKAKSQSKPKTEPVSHKLF